MITTDKNHLQDHRGQPAEETRGAADALLVDVWGMLRRRKGLLAFGLIAGLGVACLYYFHATPMYESEVQILVMEKDANLPTQGADRNVEGQNRTMYEDALATQMEIFRSRKIIADAMDKARLRDVPSIRKVIEQKEDAVEYVTKNLEVSRGGDGLGREAHVIRATYRDPSPRHCALILNAIRESYEDYVKNAFQGTGKEAYDLILEASGKLKTELDQCDAAYQEFIRNNPLVRNGDKNANLHQDRLSELETSLSQLHVRKIQTQSRLQIIEAALEQGVDKLTDLDKMGLLSDKDVERLSLLVNASKDNAWSSATFLEAMPQRNESARAEAEKLLTLRLEREKLLQDFGPDHPEVQRVEQQIKLAQEFVSRSLDKDKVDRFDIKPADLFTVYRQQLRADLADMEKQEAELRRLASQEEEAAKNLLAIELQDQKLRDDRERKQKLYDAVIERVRDIDLIKRYSGYYTQVLAPVEEAKKPSSPVLPLVLGLGAAIGLMVGMGLAYAAEVTDRTFRSPQELHQMLELPVFAHIPVLTETKAAAAHNGHGNGRIHSTVLAYHRPKSRSAEAFRGLRTAIYFDARAGQRTVIQITSPNPGDGKTTVAANLAVSMAQSGKSVLLVDCDFRKPRIHKLFGVDETIGLSNLIAGETELSDVVQSGGTVNLSVVSAGSSRSNPAELLTMPRFEQFIDQVRRQYDVVVIDSPPLLAVSDPCIIAPRVDGVLIALKIDKHGRPRALRAKEMLLGLGVTVLGLVVNGTEVNRRFGYGDYTGRYGHGYPYGYGYGYGYTYGEESNQYYDDASSKTNGSAIGESG